MKTKPILLLIWLCNTVFATAQNNRFLIAGSKPKPNAFAVTPTDVRYNPEEIAAEQVQAIKKENSSLWLVSFFEKDGYRTPIQISIQDTTTAFVFIPPRYKSCTLTLCNANEASIETLLVKGMLYTVYYSHLPEGVYFVTLRKDGKVIYQSKIVKIE